MHLLSNVLMRKIKVRKQKNIEYEQLLSKKLKYDFGEIFVAKKA